MPVITIYLPHAIMDEINKMSSSLNIPPEDYVVQNLTKNISHPYAAERILNLFSPSTVHRFSTANNTYDDVQRIRTILSLLSPESIFIGAKRPSKLNTAPSLVFMARMRFTTLLIDSATIKIEPLDTINEFRDIVATIENNKQWSKVKLFSSFLPHTSTFSPQTAKVILDNKCSVNASRQNIRRFIDMCNGNNVISIDRT